MQEQDIKCVVVIDENLPVGLLTNTAAILGITIGKHVPQAVGGDVWDNSGQMHRGIISFPVPVLKGNHILIRQLREKLYHSDFAALLAVDFSDVAQRCKTYDEFIEKMKKTSEESLNYLGIGICGDKKLVNKLTGSLPLLQ